MTAKRIVFLLIGFLFATFVVQNIDVVQVRFLFWKAQASMALIFLGAFFLGIFVGWVSRRVKKREVSASASPKKRASE